MESIINLLISIALGAVTGWLAGKIMKTQGSLLKNIIVGIIGGFLGGFLFGLIGISGSGIIGSTIISIIGACLLLFIVNKFFK